MWDGLNMSTIAVNFLKLECGQFNAPDTPEIMREIKEELQITCDGADAVWSSLADILFLTLFDPQAIERAEKLYEL